MALAPSAKQWGAHQQESLGLDAERLERVACFSADTGAVEAATSIGAPSDAASSFQAAPLFLLFRRKDPAASVEYGLGWHTLPDGLLPER